LIDVFPMLTASSAWGLMLACRTTPEAYMTKKEASVKKPYIKPEFRLEKVFVTTALSCGKTSTEGQCRTVSKSS
jgi:hypothetical protein